MFKRTLTLVAFPELDAYLNTSHILIKCMFLAVCGWMLRWGGGGCSGGVDPLLLETSHYCVRDVTDRQVWQGGETGKLFTVRGLETTAFPDGLKSGCVL